MAADVSVSASGGCSVGAEHPRTSESVSGGLHLEQRDVSESVASFCQKGFTNIIESASV